MKCLNFQVSKYQFSILRMAIFVRPSALVWYTADLVQKLGYLLSLTSLLHYTLFLFSPFIKVPFLNQSDSPVNHFFKLPSNQYDFDPIAMKVLFNSTLVAAFWLQHSIMARQRFKDTMNWLGGNLYHFYEKGAYQSLSALALMTVVQFY